MNTILTRGDGNLNDPIFKSSNVRAGGGGGEGVLKFRVVDQRITPLVQIPKKEISSKTPCIGVVGFTLNGALQQG